MGLVCCVLGVLEVTVLVVCCVLVEFACSFNGYYKVFCFVGLIVLFIGLVC